MGSDTLLYAWGHYGAPNAALWGPGDPFGSACGPFTGRKTGFRAKFGPGRPAEARSWGVQK